MSFAFLWAILAALATYELAKISKIGAIRASAGLSLVFAIIIKLSGFSQDYSALFFGGSFVGMSSSDRLNRLGVLWASVMFAVVFYFLSGYFHGIGGTLGLSAFIAVSMTMLKSKMLLRIISR